MHRPATELRQPRACGSSSPAVLRARLLVACNMQRSMGCSGLRQTSRSVLWATRNRQLLLRRPKPQTAAAPAAAAAVVAADPWHTLAVLSSCAAAAQVLESHTRVGALLSAPLIALAAALVAAAAGLLPAASPVYDVVWTWLMPLAVGLFLLEHEPVAALRGGGQVLAAFALGAVGMVGGAWVAWQLLGGVLLASGGAGPQLAAALVASYIGGSVNFMAVAAALQLPAALAPPAIAADNLAMLVLLAVVMAVPVRVINAWGQASSGGSSSPKAAASPELAGAGAGSSSAPVHRPTLPQPTALGASRRSSSKGSSGAGTSGAMGLDGSPLETQPPSAADVAACRQASSQGRRAPGSTSNSGTSSRASGSGSRSPQQLAASVTTSAPPGRQQSAQQQQQQAAGRPVGQLALDGAPLLTPDPVQDRQQQQQQQQRAAKQQQQQQQAQQQTHHTTSAAAAAAAAIGAGGAAAASPSAAAVKKAAASCGGCRASGVTALDHTPLLTAAPGMADAISTISAARAGQQQLLVGAEPGSAAAAAADASPAAGGCGCCDEALDAIAAASPPPPAAAAGGGRVSGLGALALDNSPLLTEEPDGQQLAATVAAARSGSRPERVSVSDSVASLSSSDSEDERDFELLARLSWRDLQQRLQEQQQQRDAAAAATAAAPGAVAPGSKLQQPAAGAAEAAAAGAADGCGSGQLTATTAAASLAAAVVAGAASRWLAAAAGVPSLQLLLLSGCALGLSVAGNAAHKTLAAAAAAGVLPGQQGSNRPLADASAGSGSGGGSGGMFAGSSQLGQLLMGLFFATLGASCCSPADSLGAVLPLMVYVGVMVLFHWAFLALVGPRLGLAGPALVAGSLANIGGPATAAGLVGGRGWPGLVQPVLLCGSLGYAVGTAAGLLAARLLGVAV